MYEMIFGKEFTRMRVKTSAAEINLVHADLVTRYYSCMVIHKLTSCGTRLPRALLIVST